MRFGCIEGDRGIPVVTFCESTHRAELICRVKFFAHPDMEEFRREVLLPKFHKITTEKPPESRKGEIELDQADTRIERGILALSRIQRMSNPYDIPSMHLPLERLDNQRQRTAHCIQLSSHKRPRAEQIPLADLLLFQRLERKVPYQGEEKNLDLHNGQLVPDTSSRAVDKRHDIWPDPWARWIGRWCRCQPSGRVERAR